MRDGRGARRAQRQRRAKRVEERLIRGDRGSPHPLEPPAPTERPETQAKPASVEPHAASSRGERALPLEGAHDSVPATSATVTGKAADAASSVRPGRLNASERSWGTAREGSVAPPAARAYTAPARA